MKQLVLGLLILLTGATFAQNISFYVEIINLRNSNGDIIVKAFKDSKSYGDDTPAITKIISKKINIKAGIFTTKIILPAGTYGIAFIDDENSSKEMDYSFIGMPKEGFGFSNFYLSGLSKPKFSDFSFKLAENMSPLKVRIRYM